MGVAVQFYGIKSVLSAYENMQAAAWSMLQGKQFLFKYEGEDLTEGGQQLEQLLKSVQGHSASESTYTLRVYEESSLQRVKTGTNKGKAKIYTDTPFDGSFNFKLYAEDEIDSHGGSGRSGYRQMSERLDAMETMLKAAIAERNERDTDEDSEVSGIAGVFKQMLDIPEVKTAIAGKVVQMVTSGLDRVGSIFDRPTPARIAGPDLSAAPAAPAPANQTTHMDTAQIQKLNQALVVLAGIDPNLAENLTKLAEIAKNDPAQYHSLVGMLKKL